MTLAVGAALFVTGTLYGSHKAPAAGGQAGSRVLYYVDPMNPAHTSDHPGLAPCGMKLQPVYADAGTGSAKPSDSTAPGAVRITPDQQQLIGVRVGSVGTFSGTHTLRLFGRVVPDDRRIYHVNAGAEGLVREVSAVTVGSAVKKDQWLATYAAPDLRTTIQGFLTAVDVVDRQMAGGANTPAQISVVNDNVRLATDRLQTLGISALQIEEIRKTRVVPPNFRILAPADGIILAQGLTPSLKFEKGMECYRVADLTHVWVLTDVSADEAEHLPPGTAAEVSIPGQHKALSAKVGDSLPQFDPVTRTLKLRLEVDNPGIALRPEMFVDVALPVPLPSTLAVAADAVLHSGLKATVFVEQAEGFFAPRNVETGRHLGDQVEILAGLEPGERIVTSGHFLIDSESRMKLSAAAQRAPM